MPTAQKGTGPDYARLLGYLNNAKIATSNNALYQTINGLISGVKKFQDFTSLQFTGLGGTIESFQVGLQNAINSIFASINNLGSTLDGVGESIGSIGEVIEGILEELFDRNNTDYGAGGLGSASVNNDTTTSISLSTDFDSGGLISGAVINAGGTGQHVITGNALFAANATGWRSAELHVNGSLVAKAQAPAFAELVALSVSSIQYLATGDDVELRVWQNSGGSLTIEVALQIARISYVG